MAGQSSSVAPGGILGYGIGLTNETNFDNSAITTPVTPIFSDPGSPTGMSAYNGETYQAVMPVFVPEEGPNGSGMVFTQDFHWYGQIDAANGQYMAGNPWQPGQPAYQGQEIADPQSYNPNYGGTPTGAVPDGGAIPFNPPGGSAPDGSWAGPIGGSYFDSNGQPRPAPGDLGPGGLYPDGSWQDTNGVYHYPNGSTGTTPPDGLGQGGVLPDGRYQRPDGSWSYPDGSDAPTPGSNGGGPGDPGSSKGGKPSNQQQVNPNAPYGRNPNGSPRKAPPVPSGNGACIAVRALGSSGEVYADSQFNSLCATQVRVGRPIPASFAEVEGSRTADTIYIFSNQNTRVLSNNTVNIDAETGSLLLKGEQQALLWSPIYVSVFHQNVATGGPLFSALTFSPEGAELNCLFADLTLISQEDMNLEVGSGGSSNGDLNITVAANIDMQAGVGADPGIGDIDFLSNNETTLISKKRMYLNSQEATMSISSYDWCRITATNATDYSGFASNQIVMVKGQEETWVGHDDLTMSNKTSINSLDETRVDCNAGDIKMLSGGETHIEAQTDLKLEGVNCYIGNDASGDPWKRLVHEDFVFSVFNAHRHSGVTTGSGTTGLPTLTGNTTDMTYFAKGN